MECILSCNSAATVGLEPTTSPRRVSSDRFLPGELTAYCSTTLSYVAAICGQNVGLKNVV